MLSKFGFRSGEMWFVLADDRENFVFAHHQVFFAVDFDVFASVACEQHEVADFDLQSRSATVIQYSSIADANDPAACRAVLGRIRQENPTGSFLLRNFSLNNDPIAKWYELNLGLFFGCGSH